MKRAFLIVLVCTLTGILVQARRTKVAYLDLRPTLSANYRDSLKVLEIWDDLHTVFTLQGIVNRHKPQFFINYVRNGSIDVDSYWWDKYRQKGEWLANRDTIALKSVEEAVKYFSQELRGAVVYDPCVASTSNIASSVAGIEDLVAIRYDTRPNSLYSRLILSGLKLPVRVWLVNKDGTPMFTGHGKLPGCTRNSSGSAKCDPYLWFIEKYMKTGRCDGRHAGYYLDQKWREKVGCAPINHHQLSNHDFFVARRGFFFDLSPWADEPATDDIPQSAGTDEATLRELLSQAFALGKGKRMCYIGGFPAWAYKYTKHAGGKHGDVETEWHFSEIISHYNAFKDADAIGYGALANASFWQHFPTRRRYPQAWTTLDALRKKGLIDKNGKVNDTKKYVIIYVGDYDASSWVSQRTPDIWDAPERGRHPMMWCISPVLSERIPHAMHYIRQTATPNDYFAAADNGAGYMNPGVAEAEDLKNGTTTRIDTWERHCRRYYHKWGLTVSGFIIDANGPRMKERALDAYSRFSPNGIVPQKVPQNLLFNNMPILQSGPDLVDENPTQAAKNMAATVQNSPTPFCWFRCILKTPQWYDGVISEAKKINPDITLLSTPEFFELYRLWLKQHKAH